MNDRPSPNTETPYIASVYARAVFNAVATQGHDPGTLLDGEDIDAEQISQSSLVDAAVFGRIYQRAIKLINDESLGMASGGPMTTGTFRMTCLCVIHRPCLGSIIKRAAEFFDVCLSAGIKPEIVDDNSRVCIGFASVAREPRTIENILSLEHPMAIRTSLYFWTSFLGWFAGHKLPLLEVAFHFDKPQHCESWQAMFECPIRFNQPRSMICFKSEVLNYPNVQNEKALRLFLKTAPYQLIVPSFREEKLQERVLALFGDDLTQPLPSAREISIHLGISVSTLRRQLNTEASSFQGLKDQHRLAAAMQYLASPELSLADVAALTGFDESSAFFRAFKRWTGKTPSQYRESL